MKPKMKVFRFCCHSFLYAVVTLLVILAISLSLARVLLPSIDGYKEDIERWVSLQVGQQIEIATLDAAWYGFEPQLVLKGVRLLSDDRMQTHGYFQQARLGIDLISSALEGRIRPGAFTLDGARFVLIRQENGTISLEGFANPDDKNTTGKNRLLDEWFLKQRFLDVKNSEVVWIDRMGDRKSWLFSDVNLRFRNNGARHWVDGWVNLPDSLGAKLKVALDVRGNLLAPNAWSGNAYLESEKLSVSSFSQYFPSELLSINSGEVDLRLWTQWRKAKLYSFEGTATLHDARISAKNAPKIRVINQLSATFSGVKSQTDWEATLDKIVVKSGRRLWPEARVDIRYNPFHERLVAEVSHVDLQEVLPVASLFLHDSPMIGKAISGLKTKGTISNINVVAYKKDDKYQFLVKGGFSHLSFRPWDNIPGLSSLDGRFYMTNQTAKLEILPQKVNLDYPQMFLEKHRLTDFQTTLYSHFDNTSFNLAANDTAFTTLGIDVEGSLGLIQQEEGTLQLDLAFYLSGGDVRNASRVVPAKIMPKETIDWLDDSLLKGKLTQSGVLFYGDLGEYPFNASEGRFNVNLKITDGTFQFIEDWPVISKIDGVFNLNSRTLSFYGHTGETMGTTLKNIQVDLPYYLIEHKYLTITGQAYGKTQDKLRYLFNSPIAQDYAQEIQPLALAGQSELDLDLKIPLSFPLETIFFGELKVKENRITADEWLLDVEKIKGSLRFNNDGLWSDNLEAEMRGVPISGSVETIKTDVDHDVIIHTSAVVSHEQASDFMDFFIEKKHWGDYLKGESDIQADIIFPISTEQKPLQLMIRSDMAGMSLDLPYPLRKTSEETKAFSLMTDLTGTDRQLSFQYGDTHGVFQMFASEETVQMLRGGIGFREKAVLPEEIGYRFTGKLKEFAWAEWGPLLIPEDDKKALLESSGGSSGSIYFDVAVEDFALFGNQFGDTLIQASHTAQLWSMHLSGERLEGNIIVPVVLSSAPMVVNMTRLHIVPESEQEIISEIDPREMPEIKLKVEDFKYKDISFGSLEINATKTMDGLRLGTFKIKSGKTIISAMGDWVIAENGQLSQFEIDIDSQDIGQALKSWGFAGAISGGTGTVTLDVSWPGKPSDFSFNTATGDMAINVKDASMLGFDLGAAKMFGLFLPRRLLLDFRDVFKKGMHFDEIKGNYNIQSGDAFTSGLFLKGPVADIHMAGRLGLSRRDYDQVVTVNRRLIGDSVPVLAALAVNPLLAAQVFIIKKMFEKQIDDILSIQYIIEGNWDNPKITPVIKNAVTGEDLSEGIFDE